MRSSVSDRCTIQGIHSGKGLFHHKWSPLTMCGINSNGKLHVDVIVQSTDLRKLSLPPPESIFITQVHAHTNCTCFHLLLFSFFSTDIKLCCCWQRAQGTGQKVKTTLKVSKIDSAIGVESETQSSLSTQLIEVSKVVHTTRFRSIHPLICITGYNYLSLSRMSTNM